MQRERWVIMINAQSTQCGGTKNHSSGLNNTKVTQGSNNTPIIHK